MKSLTYWHPAIYSFLIRLSFRSAYSNKYTDIVKLIKEGSSVTDVCCGDCRLYYSLKEKNIRYLGLDYNKTFIDIARKKGINVKRFDIKKDEIPSSDYVVLQGSLYQFIPDQDKILKKLFDSANKYLVISEALKNNIESRSRIISYISKKLNNPGDGEKIYRFTPESFKKAMAPFKNKIESEFLSSNGIEYITVIKK